MPPALHPRMDRRQREPIGTTRLIRRPIRNAGTRGGKSKPPRQPRPRQRHRGPRRRGRRSRKLIRPIPMRMLLRLRKNRRLPSGLRLRLREFQSMRQPLAPPAPRRAGPPIARVPVPAADPRGENQPVTTAATGMPATTDNVAWPAPPSMPQTAGAAGSPFPPPPDMGSQPDPSGAAAAQAPSADGSTAAAGASAAADPPSSATGQQPTAEAPGNDGAAPKADSDAPVRANPPGRISVLLVLVGLIVLLAVGMLLRRLVEHALSRRRVINLARQEPRLVEPVAGPPPMPALLRHAPSVVPGPAQAQQRATEVEAELRKFAQNLRQRRPVANNTANGTLGRGGAAVRS